MKDASFVRRTQQKAHLVHKIRAFFLEHSFIEVFPPLLSPAIPLEPNLTPFTTTWLTRFGEKKLYLAQSPERALKYALASGVSDCYAISPSFRNLEQEGSMHSAEFQMLEWYRKDADYKKIMKDVTTLIAWCAPDRKYEWKTVSLCDMFIKYTGLSLDRCIAQESLLYQYAESQGYQTSGSTWSQLYDQIFVNMIEPRLSGTLFLVDFPTCISPLCKPQLLNPLFAERFEVYINGVEIGNGNTEQTDVDAVRSTFLAQQRVTHLPMDEEFLSSLQSMNHTSYAGIGIGVERLQKVLGFI